MTMPTYTLWLTKSPDLTPSKTTGMIYDTSLDTATDANLSESHKRAPKSRFNQSCGALPLTVVYGILVGFIKILLRVIGYMFFIISCKVLFVV